jgi:transposase-like protein
MAEIACLNGHREWINLEPHLTGLSLPNTVDLLDCLGVKRSHKAIHDRVRKADLQPEAGQIPNHIALDETVIRINDLTIPLDQTAHLTPESY